MHVVQSSPVTVTVGHPVAGGSPPSPPVLPGGSVGTSVGESDGGSDGEPVGRLIVAEGVSEGISPAGMLMRPPSSSCAMAGPTLELLAKFNARSPINLQGEGNVSERLHLVQRVTLQRISRLGCLSRSEASAGREERLFMYPWPRRH